MLQQTRVAAAIPYFERFMTRFPTFEVLADAPESEILTHWAGLGYYYRARNLQKAARLMKQRSAFPDTHEQIRALPGVGDYTAAAIASIAFGLPHAAVDGNALRVLTRVHDDAADVASLRGRKHVAQLAGALLDTARPGDFNQAVIELGATVCSPKRPQCLVCPVSGLCQARQTGNQDLRPVRFVKTKSIEEERTVFWIEEAGQLLVWQRPESSRLMPGFWELPERSEVPAAVVGERLGSFKHGITFRNYRFEIRRARVQGELGMCCWVHIESLSRLPLSTVLKKAMRVVTRTKEARESMPSSAAAC